MKTERRVKHGQRLRERSEYSEHKSFRDEYYCNGGIRLINNFNGDWWSDYPWSEYRDVSKSWKDQSKKKHQYQI